MTDHRAYASTTNPDHISRDRIARVRRWWNGFLDARTPWIFDDGAQERSIGLLKQNLSPTQREQYDKHRFFDVIGGRSGTRYRIHEGHQLNVDLLDPKGNRTAVLCFMPEGRLAFADVMLAQKLALELFEEEAIAVANEMLAEPRRFRGRSDYPMWG